MEEVANHLEWQVIALDREGEKIAEITTATRHGHEKFVLRTALKGAIYWVVSQHLVSKYAEGALE